jgi:hypothetical protein
MLTYLYLLCARSGEGVCVCVCVCVYFFAFVCMCVDKPASYLFAPTHLLKHGLTHASSIVLTRMRVPLARVRESTVEEARERGSEREHGRGQDRGSDASKHASERIYIYIYIYIYSFMGREEDRSAWRRVGVADAPLKAIPFDKLLVYYHVLHYIILYYIILYYIILYYIILLYYVMCLSLRRVGAADAPLKAIPFDKLLVSGVELYHVDDIMFCYVTLHYVFFSSSRGRGGCAATS